MSEQIKIKIPDKYQLSDGLVNEIQLLNSDLKIGTTNGNTLLVEENIFRFENYESIELKFPTSVFPDSNFDELYDINETELNFEQPGNHSIILKMGTFYVIGLITGAIFASLFVWAKNSKKGRTLPEDTEYDFSDNEEELPEQIRMADSSYISYDKVSEEEQKKWGRKRIPIPPTLSIEVVSSKYGLKPALRKMQDVWMNYGTDLGVVVCPFSKKLYIFKKGKPGYTEQSIYKPFTHPLLPGYEGDFSEYVDEIQ